MNQKTCVPKILTPKIPSPEINFDDEEIEVLRLLLGKISREIVETEKVPRHSELCGIGLIAAERLAGMSDIAKKESLKRLRILAKTTGRGKGKISDDKLGDSLRRMFAKRLDSTRPAIRDAIKDLGRQYHDMGAHVSKTSLLLTPDSEHRISPTREVCSGLPEKYFAEWTSSEPGANRVYWELRGPKDGSGNLPFLARGYSENQRIDGTVGGAFLINMANFAPMFTPPVTAVYHLRVLPLAAPSNNVTSSIVGKPVYGFGFEPPAPEGLGAWSYPAIIKIGRDCISDPLPIDVEEIDYYRKVKLRMNWFRVNTDQAGPGDEEYRIRIHLLKSMLESKFQKGQFFFERETSSLGSFMTYQEVEEGDTSKKPLHFSSTRVFLPKPPFENTPSEPVFAFVMSVLEQDSGDWIDDFDEMMQELLEHLLHIELDKMLGGFTNDFEEETEEAKEALFAQLLAEFGALIVAMIYRSASGALIAFILATIGSIRAWLIAGAVDDFYGVETVLVRLKSNDRLHLIDGSGLDISSSKVLTSGGNSNTCSESGGVLTSKEIVMQLISSDSPDAAGFNGSVSFGMELEFSDLQQDYA